MASEYSTLLSCTTSAVQTAPFGFLARNVLVRNDGPGRVYGAFAATATTSGYRLYPAEYQSQTLTSKGMGADREALSYASFVMVSGSCTAEVRVYANDI